MNVIVTIEKFRNYEVIKKNILQTRIHDGGTMADKKFWPSLSVNSKKKNCNPYFIVIMITVLIMNAIFWVVNFKTQNYFVISTRQNVYLRLSMYVRLP
jgi:t-SNARE complex subunit (syntaxin)